MELNIETTQSIARILQNNTSLFFVNHYCLQDAKSISFHDYIFPLASYPICIYLLYTLDTIAN